MIHAHTEWQPEPITSSELAARLGVAPSSVTEMVKKLAEQGFVEHTPYRAVVLTEAGRAEALRMTRRHRLLETWLVREFGYGWDEVHDEAEVLEHAVSDRLLDAIAARLGNPERDPHGDPIPAPDGRMPTVRGDLLDDLPAGTRGRVVRISDRDPAVLRDLTASGVGLDATVVAGELPAASAQAVWVDPER